MTASVDDMIERESKYHYAKFRTSHGKQATPIMRPEIKLCNGVGTCNLNFPPVEETEGSLSIQSQSVQA